VCAPIAVPVSSYFVRDRMPVCRRLNIGSLSMSNRSSLRLLLWGLAAGLATLAPSAALAGSTLTVATGYDLFQTDQSSYFNFGGAIGTQALEGVALGTYNFGGSIGVQNVGLTDTIIQRNSAVTVAALGDSGTTGLTVDALQLRTVNAVDSNGDYLFVTLATGSQPTDSSMTIAFATTNGGTFTSFLDMNLKILLGKTLASATLVETTELTLSNSGDTWIHTPPPPGSVVINGVNYMLDGADTNEDFFPGVGLTEVHPGGGQHVVDPAATPEPGTLVLCLTAAVLVPAYVRRVRRRVRSIG
jgi:hypothetical protein